MRYVIYISVLVLLAAGLSGYDAFLDAPTFGNTVFVILGYLPAVITVIFVLMAHHLAVLTVARQRRVFGSFEGIAGRYPEALAPLLVLTGWGVIGVSSLSIWTAVATGLLFALALAVCYALVRIVNEYSTRSAKLSAPTPVFSAKPIARLTTRSVYALRVLVASTSVYGLLVFAFTDNISIWLSAFTIAVICAAAVLAFCGMTFERTLAQSAGKTAKQAIAAQLALNPTELALYYSGAVTSKHTAPLKLVNRFTKEGIPTVIIAREAGARQTLVKALNSDVWFCPTIGTLDAVAQPDLKVIFYVNDAAKNGHFIRFNEYAHVLQATGMIAAGPSLPQSCAVYDAIIAPDNVKANEWREAATHDMAKRIVTVGKISSYAPASQYPMAQPVLTLHLGGALDIGDREALLDRLPKLINTVTQNGLARLQIWFPTAPQGAGDPILRRLHRAVETALPAIEIDEDEDEVNAAEVPLVTVHTGTVTKAANAADFPIATAASDLDGLRGSGKPLLWFDTCDVPDGFIQLQEDTDGLSAALDRAWNEPLNQTSKGLDMGHFATLTELIEAVKDVKFGSEQTGPTS